jgi:hypothetical protein
MFETLTEAEWDRVDDAWDLVESADLEKAQLLITPLQKCCADSAVGHDHIPVVRQKIVQ